MDKPTITNAFVPSETAARQQGEESDFPRTLNLGSGKDFRADCFNIDIDDTWAPDAVIDLSGVDLDDKGIVLSTARFGNVRFYPGCFERIITNDVIEHVPNLVAFMTTCLRLLRIGGVFEISVPYDLSFGAWQDPTHVRAFNERSWLYYTDWFWYLGWSDARFHLDKMQFVPSPYGKELNDKGVTGQDLIRMPRAIDTMSVTLRKVELDENDRKTWNYWRERRAEARQRNAKLAPVQVANPAPQPVKQVERAFADGWEAHRNRHCIWIVSPQGYIHNQVFAEVSEALSSAFDELGGSAPVVYHPRDWNGRIPIVFGPNLLGDDAHKHLPRGSILFNLEQMKAGSTWMNETYLSLLKAFPVLDYSVANRRALAEHGISHVELLPIGYADCLTRIKHNDIKDIDVLFYGSLNNHRKTILDRLSARGVNVVSLCNEYGPSRDAYIGRAKIAINIHFYEDAIFEVARVSYLLANRVCVLTEAVREDYELRPFAEGLAVAPTDGIVDRCLELLANDAARETLSQKGFELMSARRQSTLLRQLFER